jgi:RNA polymerase sigma-70 factor, ECF subfamily
MPAAETTTVLIVADDEPTTEAIRRELRGARACSVIEWVAGRRPCAGSIAAARPDVVVLVDSGTSASTLARIGDAAAALSETKLVLLTERMEPDWLAKASAAGADAAIGRTLQPGSLGAFLHEVAHGNAFHTFRSPAPRESKAEPRPGGQELVRARHVQHGGRSPMLVHSTADPRRDGLRSAADDLAGRAARTGFQRRSGVERSPEGDAIVARAVARAKEGDRDAIRYLYLRYSDNVYSYVRTILRDDHEAEDVTQHVFAKLITVISKYEQRTAPFAGWILRLAHNAAVDHLRGQRSAPAGEIFGENDRADEDADRSTCLREALSTLPEEQRRVVVLRHVVGLTPPEIAAEMGHSESSVHGLHHRGRRALQAELVRMEAGPVTARADAELPIAA